MSNISEHIYQFFTKAGSQSKDTEKTYLNGLNMLANRLYNKEVHDLTTEEIEAIDYLKIEDYMYKLSSEGNSNTTINNRIMSIKSFINFLSKRDVIKYDLGKLDLISKLPDDGEVTERIPEETLYEYVNYFEQFERNGKEKKWVCLLLLETANRAQDTLNLTKNQFVQEGEFYILKSKGRNQGKGGAGYFEKIGKELYDELMNLNPESDKVFSISYRSLSRAFERANEHFGNRLIKYSPHSIKHLALHLEYMYTRDILAVQRKGNHKNLTTTQRYLGVVNTIIDGAYTRRLNTKEDLFKEVSHQELLSAIDEMPLDSKVLLNQLLAKLKK
jgi:site-specific recombinase XerD